jgi:hypothetical protein
MFALVKPVLLLLLEQTRRLLFTKTLLVVYATLRPYNEKNKKPSRALLLSASAFFLFCSINSQTSLLLTSSLSLGVPVPRPTQCMGGA